VHKSRAPVARATKVLRRRLIFVSPQYGTCFKLLFWRLEFWDCSKVLESLCTPGFFLCVQSLIGIIFNSDNWREARYSLFFEASRPALGPIQPRSQWVARVYSLRVKRPKREAEQSPLTNTEVKNECRYTSTPLNVFIACKGIRESSRFRRMTDFVYTVMDKFNTICSVRCDYSYPHTPTNAHNLYKIIKDAYKI
jgi:hypothetical protein